MSRRFDAVDSAAAALHALRAAGAAAGLVSDTRLLSPGDVFVAWPGAASDPRRHLDEAFARGAVAAVVEAHGAVPRDGVLPVRGLKRLAGELADAWWNHPSRQVRVLAVTGTNGKTSCALWTAQALAAAGHPCGVVGTLGVGLPGALRPTGLTTPDPVRLHAELAAMRDRGVLHCAIEASSIGLDEQRLAGLRLHAAAFTNLTQDHLDWHGTMEAYAASKRRLFDWHGLSAAVFHVGDAFGARLAREAGQRGLAVRTCAVGADAEASVDWRCDEPADAAAGMALTLRRGAREATLALPLIGRFNAENVLVVCGLLETCGLEFDAVVRALGAIQAPPGRMQPVGAEPLAVVDYAHTPDAVGKALDALRPLARRRGGQLWCVLGAGGDRDRAKRAPMAAAAAAGSDRVVLTSDNPRSEDPRAILDDMLAGLGAGSSTALALVDRAAAIAEAVQHAAPADVVLIAGKGHEATQEQGGRRIAFSDVFHARCAVQARGAGAFDLRELAVWVGGRVIGDPATRVGGVGTDTRALGVGDLFVALRGERFDAHDFLDRAVAAGARAVLAERGVAACGLPGVEVDDSLAALGALARAWRRQQPAMPLIAVTGSNGKTTVTQMIASILAAWRGEQGRLATRGNFNNEIGLPLTLLRLRPEHLAGVVELGMNHPGEVARLAAIAEPSVALVNNAQREHQEFMHTVEAVARENGQAIAALGSEGCAVWPVTDAHAAVWSELAGARRVMRFALAEPGRDAPPAEVVGRIVDSGAALRLQLHTPLGDAVATLQVFGAHNAHNALAATAAALAAGAPLDSVIAGLEAFRPVAGRMRRELLRRLDGGELLLIDDSYNANPDSVRAAIEALAAVPGRRALVLGDMGEVGAQGPEFHAEAGRLAAALGLDALRTVGSAAAHAAAAAGGIDAVHAAAIDGIDLDTLLGFDAVLVKGSRFMGMERVVDALRRRCGASDSVEDGHAA